MRAMKNQITTMRTKMKNNFETSMAKQHNEQKNMMTSFIQMHSPSALVDLGASINLMPFSVWKKLSLPELTPTRMTLKLANRSVAYPKLSLPELTPTRMTLELANRSVAYPVGVAKDVFIKVGKFHFSADFVVVDYDVDPRVPLILGRTYVACKEYAQEVLGFLNSSTSGNLTPSDPIISASSPSFTLFEGSDFILEEIETFLRTPDELSTLDDDFDLEGDIALIEKLLNKDPSLNLPLM
nr:hypothetical protein [Tanacetum cinerariifolium]